MKRGDWVLAMLLLLCSPLCASAANVLFANGRTAYSIVLPATASVSEQTAAKELQHYLRKISGAVFPITDTISTASDAPSVGGRIYVGWHEDCGLPCPAPSDEGFTYRTVDGNLHIFGGSQRGTMYGVFTFLERELGVHWYTSHYTHVPRLRRYELPRLDHSEQPAIRQRLDFCYDALRHDEWVAHNRLNNQRRLVNNKYGTLSAYWGIHTFNKLLPPEKYFDTHPEYYSVSKGQRSAKAQLCLSNEDMRRELTENLKKVIRKNPGYWCYDVSQNDNLLDCECEPCMELTERYGGRSGAILWFVNQVAADVALEFPDVYVGTFAYHTTRRPPRDGIIAPAANVVVRLCDSECCMAHPIDSCMPNNDFADDLKQWMQLTPNVYIWDYATIFFHYLLPFPNFRTMAANYRLFSRAGVIGVMEEGAHDAPWSEFSELKQWLIAKLMWNPQQDVDSLASLFIGDYYGAAAPYIRRYYDLCQDRTAQYHFTMRVEPANPFFADSFATDGQWLLEDAIAAADDEQTLQRTKRLAAQMYYLRLRRNPQEAMDDGSVEKLQDIIAADSTIVREKGYSLQTVLNGLKLK